MKKFDFILAGAMFIIALVWFLINTFTAKDGNIVVVSHGNIVQDRYLLSDDGDYEILTDDGGTINFTIANSTVNVTHANCKDKLCVNQKPISKSNEVICCLPNNIIIQVINNDSNREGNDLDAISY